MDRIVLAYSGGLDTTAAIVWLAEARRAEIVALTLDLGQGGELESLRERALASGCARAHVLDVRGEFADRAILPALKAGAMRDGRAPLAAALARPLLAAKLVEIARIEGAVAVAHGGSGAGERLGRIDTLVAALDPALRVLAPAREWGMSRADVYEYVRSRGLATPTTAPGAPRVDANLWGRSVTIAPDAPVPAGFFLRTADPAATPVGAAVVDIVFDAGVPVAVNGVTMAFADVIGSLDTIAASHGVGRLDTVRPAAGGEAREVVEAPAAVVLAAAHAALERAVAPADLARVKQAVSAGYADMIDDGRWYSPVREALDAFVAAEQARVKGTVRVRLSRGSCAVVSCEQA